MPRAAITVLLVSTLTLICHVAAHRELVYRNPCCGLISNLSLTAASPLAVAVVIEQFKNAKIVPVSIYVCEFQCFEEIYVAFRTSYRHLPRLVCLPWITQVILTRRQWSVIYLHIRKLKHFYHSQVGDALPKSLTSTTPINVYIRGTAESEAAAGGPFNVTTVKYTLLIIDAGPPGSQNPQGFNLHWLANNWSEISQNPNNPCRLHSPSFSLRRE
jgi:hypothetical protein